MPTVQMPVALLYDPWLGLAETMLSPAGRPEAKYERVPLWVSLAWIDKLTELLTLKLCRPGSKMVMGSLIFQLKVCLALYVPSAAATVTEYGPNAAAPGTIVPVIAPVPVLMDRPAGKPKA